MSDNLEHYPGMARFFHWAIAIMILFNLLSGMILAYFKSWSHEVDLFAIHKQIGIIILLLVFLRIIWRFTHTYPSLNAFPFAAYEKTMAHLGHMMLYILMLFIPITGLFFSQSAGREVYLLWFKLPQIIAKQDKGVVLQIFNLHKYLSIAIATFVAIHVIAVIKHHLIDKIPLVYRMLPKGWRK